MTWYRYLYIYWQAIQVIQSAVTVTVQGGIGLTEAQARAGSPCQKDFKLGGPRCCCTVPGSDHWTGPSSRWAIQVILQLIQQLSRSLAGSDSPKHWRVRAVPVRKTSNCQWAAPACCCTVPGSGHQTGSSGLQAKNSLLSLSGESIQGTGRIGLTEALARAGQASQYTICTCTICTHTYLHEFIVFHHPWIKTCGYPVQDVDIYLRISRLDLGISISIYIDILRDIHMKHLDI